MSEQREQYQATDEKLKQIAADLAGDGSKPEEFEIVHVQLTKAQRNDLFLLKQALADQLGGSPDDYTILEPGERLSDE